MYKILHRPEFPSHWEFFFFIKINIDNVWRASRDQFDDDGAGGDGDGGSLEDFDVEVDHGGGQELFEEEANFLERDNFGLLMCEPLDWSHL